MTTPPKAAAPADAAPAKGPLEPAEGDLILAERFAPWVRALGLSVLETGARHAVLRLPWSDQLARDGGGLSGQAMMAAADTATVVAVSSALGGFAPMTTVQQSITFQRAARDTDLLVTARLTKLGRRIAFAEITLATPDAPDDPVAHATTVYAFPG
ncbi:PaaI family thioesterase [Kitasatospora sp. NPDC059673]|uniref:PaaI family thioesterase n=1 Tax=Kitasatospora sp. NPDC059673 TaxID=3346901 RepID=UPI0036BC4653